MSIFIATTTCSSAGGSHQDARRNSKMVAEEAEYDDYSRDAESTSVAKRSLKTTGTDKPQPKPEQQKRMMIYQAHLRSTVSELDTAIAHTQKLIKRYTGYVEKQSINKEAAQASFKIRVPVKHFDALVAALSQLGELDLRQIQAQDITRQYGDLVQQLQNRKQLLKRLYEILQKTTNTKQRIRILNEIARLEKEIDSMETRRKFLASRASFSTIYWRMTAAKKMAVHPGSTIDWIRNLRPEKRSLYESPSYSIPLPAGFIDNSEDWDSQAQAMYISPEDVQIRCATIKNQPKGDAVFYQKALQYERQRFPQKPSLLERKGQQLHLVTPQQVGYKQAFYELYLRVDGDQLHITEVFYPDQAAYDKHHQAVAQSVRQFSPQSRFFADLWDTVSSLW